MTENSTNGQSPFTFRDQAVYTAKITDQALTENSKFFPQIALQVQLKGMLKRPNDPSSGEVPIPPGTPDVKTIFLTYGDNDTSKQMFFADLISLGARSPDLAVYDPAHPKFTTEGKLVGKDILVRLSIRADNDPAKPDKHWWNVHRTQQALQLKAVSPQALEAYKSSEGPKAFREAMAKARQNPTPAQQGY